MRKLLLGLATATFLAGVAIPFVGAQNARRRTSLFEQTLRIRLTNQSNRQIRAGVQVINRRQGPDSFRLLARGLKPRTRYTVFLTQSSTLGALPAQFIGEFRSNRFGNGELTLVTEIVNAFASSNQSLEDANGVADQFAAGALANGANTIPLNFIRVYEARGTNVQSVFGGSDQEVGGGLVLASTRPLP